MPLCLIVDDDEMLCETMSIYLKKWGLDVVTQPNGLKALEWCNQNKMPHFILLDMKMPQVDGFSFIKALHKMPNGKKPKIIASTGLNDLESVKKLSTIGLVAYLVKPYDIGKLKETLLKLSAFVF